MNGSSQHAMSLRDLADQVRARTSLVELVGARLPLKRSGREMRGCCPFHNEKTPSFYVIERKGFFHCFGCSAHGSAIDFVMRLDQLDFASAVRRLAQEAGLVAGSEPVRRKKAAEVPRVTPPEIDAERARDADRAASIWRQAVPGAGTPVETYLRSRAIRVPVPPTLRFVPALPYWTNGPGGRAVKVGEFPAMVAAIQGANGAIVGLHRTYLSIEPDGAVRKLAGVAPDGDPLTAKKMLGQAMGGAVRLAKAGETLAIAEGIETALSVLQAFPDMPVWAVLSLVAMSGSGDPKALKRRRAADDPKTLAAFAAGRSWPRLETDVPDMARPGFVPPDGVREILLLADADNKDQPQAQMLMARAATRFSNLGLKVRVAWPTQGHDFNSMLMAGDVAARMAEPV
jgi:DNA primase